MYLKTNANKRSNIIECEDGFGPVSQVLFDVRHVGLNCTGPGSGPGGTPLTGSVPDIPLGLEVWGGPVL